MTRLDLNWNGQGFLISWRAALHVPDPSPSPGLRAVRISPKGSVLDAEPLRIADGDVASSSGSGDGAGHSLLVYAAFDPENTAYQTRVITRLLTVTTVDGGLSANPNGPADGGLPSDGASGP